MNAEVLDAVPGGPELRAWFDGRVPSFHDAEVLSVTLDRAEPSCVLRVHAFQMTSEVNSDGVYILKNHAVVTFRIGAITAMELDGFNHQNALMGLSITSGQTEVFGGDVVEIFRIELDPAYGLAGFVEGQSLSIGFEAGIPVGSQYEKRADLT